METNGRTRNALGVTADVASEVGARLEQARMESRRSTSSIAQRIKVREHYIVAMEKGQWDSLPPGLNGRGLVRLYARELGVQVPELDLKPGTSVPASGTGVPANAAPLSRAIDEGELTRESLEMVRSIPRSSTNAPPPPSRREVTPPARADHTQEGRRGTKRPIHERRSHENDDEEALDILTPDVASILGISMDELPADTSKKAKPADEPPPPPAVPEVSAERLAAEMFADTGDIPTPPVPPRVEKIERPSTLPEPRATEPTVVPVTPVPPPPAVASAPVTQVPPPPAVASAPVTQVPRPPAPPVTASAVSARPQPPVEDVAMEVGGREASGFARAPEALSEAPLSQRLPTDEESGAARRFRKKVTRKHPIGLYAAAAALVVGVVGFLVTHKGSDDDFRPRVVESEANRPLDPAPESAQNEPGLVATLAAVPMNTEPTAAVGQSTPQETAPVAAASIAPQATPQAVPPTPTVAVPVPTPAVSAPTPAVPTTEGPRKATLTITEEVEIQVTVDGKRVYSGTHEPGPLDVEFSKTAEILVQDGAKVRLNYENWDHGVLGHPGRKRKLVLSAVPYTE